MNSKMPSSDNSSGTSRPQWKFLEAMSFLLPLKLPQKTAHGMNPSGQHSSLLAPCLPIEIDDGLDNELSLNQFSIKCEAEAYPGSGFDKVETESWEEIDNEPKMKKLRGIDEDQDDTSLGVNESSKGIFANLEESPRMGFFRSILPMVDELSSSNFLTFQMKVLQSLMEVRNDPGCNASLQR